MVPDKAWCLLRAGDKCLLPTLTWHLLPGVQGLSYHWAATCPSMGLLPILALSTQYLVDPTGRLLIPLTPLTVSLWFTPPGSLTQAIRNFAKSLEGWLINAMSGFPQQVIQTKVWIWGTP